MKKRRPRVLMIGVDDQTFGGMTAVQQSYRQHWDYELYDLRYIGVFRDGPALTKILIALRGFLIYLYRLLTWYPDLIHVHFSWRGSVYRKSVFMLIGRMIGCVVIGHGHSYDFERFYQGQPPLAQAYIRFVFRQLTHLIVLSPIWKAYYQKFLPPARITVLYNPAPVPEKATFDRASPNILFLGELGSRKGVYDLLAVLPNIVAKYPDMHVYLCGNGEIERVQQVVNDSHLSRNVTVTGWIHGDQKQKYLKQAMILVLPSHNEGLPVAVIEAMMHGIPVITTPVGGIPDIFDDGQHLRLVEVGNHTQLGVALDDLLSSTGLRQRLASAAYTFATDTFSPAVILSQLYALYRQLGVAPENPDTDAPAKKST